MGFFKSALRSGFYRFEALLDNAFGSEWNPMTQLGALGYFFYWIVAVSGIYLYIAFDTSVIGVYESVEYLTNDQWYLGGIMRSFHRYASDAMVLFMLVHMLREFALDRYRGARAFSWLTGIPLIWLVYAAGITGYWLVWDELAQYLAIKTMEWLDYLPIFGEPIARNFLAPDRVDDRFFSLLIFMHIFVPLFLLLVMWIHIQRISKPKVNPPRGLAAGLMAMLFAVSLYTPAISHGPADLTLVPANLNLDWYYLGLYPLFDILPAGIIWAAAIGFTALLVGVPYAARRKRPPAAVVDLSNCNGCERCMDDCPYSAITMVPRTDGLPFDRQASVNPSLCVACGICSGACPTAQPFRRKSDLVPGIEIPGLPIKELREQVDNLDLDAEGGPRIVIFGCENGAKADALNKKSVGVVSLPCIGMLPPAFIDYALSKKLVEGVFLAGCRDGECFNRLGGNWMKSRILRERDPYLRRRVPRDRLHYCGVSAIEGPDLKEEFERFETQIQMLSSDATEEEDLKKRLRLGSEMEEGVS